MFMTSNFTVVSNSFCELVHFENRDGVCKWCLVSNYHLINEAKKGEILVSLWSLLWDVLC